MNPFEALEEKLTTAIQVALVTEMVKSGLSRLMTLDPQNESYQHAMNELR